MSTIHPPDSKQHEGFHTFTKHQLTVGLAAAVRVQKCSIHRFEAGRAGKGAHQPVINALSVVGMHAWQVPNLIPNTEVYHADHTPATGMEF